MVKKKDVGTEGLFIPAGVFIGMGLGFLYNNLVSYMFIGMGVGFLLTIIFSYINKKKKD